MRPHRLVKVDLHSSNKFVRRAVRAAQADKNIHKNEFKNLAYPTS